VRGTRDHRRGDEVPDLHGHIQCFGTIGDSPERNEPIGSRSSPT
jgi:hypothetical protein